MAIAVIILAITDLALIGWAWHTGHRLVKADRELAAMHRRYNEGRAQRQAPGTIIFEGVLSAEKLDRIRAELAETPQQRLARRRQEARIQGLPPDQWPSA